MNNWKLILPLMMSGSLIACTSTQTTTEPVEPETPKVEQPVTVEPEVKPEVEPKPEVKPKPETKPEKKPEPEPEPKKTVKVQKTPDGMLILGSEEWVYVPAIDQTFKARVDTGATTSSISATEIVPFERDGKDWVQFKIDINGKTSKEFKVPVERWAKVKQSSSDEVDKRAVVVAYIQVGDYKEKTEFTLADRDHMKFPILLGRSFFRDIAVVDVSKKYIQDKPTKSTKK
ncbi:ATP-dependent zinc protease family protein [Vibrio parahaemolyticus]|uniref:ATP-dependent zinc protease family protein n=1 Tax=Vibrio parahaemolyticus TaxID=670 RepID=UPI00041D50A9|nr:ATP-dependent zinc protease [Vibrio parahaemolyticus]KCV75666.1 ATP-dependent Zn protease [Vibrio parahaemolyticus VP49]EGQ8179648.1 ATP-dependent zinc protease [Vibrio parahaemolyticus]EJG1578817.1 ATP-dependent zinc protease [Vibrio parahaemolyticus]MCI9721641.1 ATP-dependent zinc protease [Vibrio parahaemolyticus]MCZ6391576.1 ATP-dependent zinc protease [Vibrio parahaemolyticus]